MDVLAHFRLSFHISALRDFKCFNFRFVLLHIDVTEEVYTFNWKKFIGTQIGAFMIKKTAIFFVK